MASIVPYIAINNIPLDCQAFVWPLASGPISPRVSFEVSHVVHEELLHLKNPVTYHYDVTNYDAEKPIVSKGSFSGLYLIEQQQVDYATFQWTIADQRVLYPEMRITAAFNVPRIVNELNLPGFEARGGDLKIGAGAANPNFDAISRYRYRPHTMQALGSLQFATPQAGVTTAAKPWTALQALLYVIQVASKRYPTITVRNEITDNGYMLQNEQVFEEQFPTVVARLLNYCRASIYLAHDGAWVIYDISVEPNFSGYGGYEGANTPSVLDISRLVPRELTVRFPREYEIRFDYYENTDGDGGTVGSRGITTTREPVAGQVTNYEFGLENVMPLPEAVGDKAAQTWVTISEGIALWNADSVHPWSHGKPLTLENIRRLGSSTVLLRFYAWKRSGGIDEILSGRIMTVLAHYRKTFRFPTTWFPMIESWSPVQVNVVDQVTAQRQPSPVWVDYSVIPSTRMPTGLMVPEAAKRATIINRAFPLGSGKAPPLADAKQAPATISVVNKELGIFRINMQEDRERYIASYIISALSRDVVLDLARSKMGLNYLLENIPLADDFHFSTLLSVSFSTPNDTDRLHEVKVSNPQGGSPHTYDYFYAQEPARYRWVDGKSSASPNGETGQVELKGFELTNEKILQAVAKAFFNRIAFSFVSRVHGIYRKVGFDATKDRPMGYAKGVGVHFMSNGLMEASLDISEQPPAMDLRCLLPTDVRRYIYRELEHPGSRS